MPWLDAGPASPVVRNERPSTGFIPPDVSAAAFLAGASTSLTFFAGETGHNETTSLFPSTWTELETIALLQSADLWFLRDTRAALRGFAGHGSGFAQNPADATRFAPASVESASFADDDFRLLHRTTNRAGTFSFPPVAPLGSGTRPVSPPTRNDATAPEARSPAKLVTPTPAPRAITAAISAAESPRPAGPAGSILSFADTAVAREPIFATSTRLVASSDYHPGGIGIIGTMTFPTPMVFGQGTRIFFELGPGSHDRLSGTTIVLNGTINVSFAHGFQSTIQPTQTFTLISASVALGGDFMARANGTRITTADGFGTFELNLGQNSLTLSNFQTFAVAIPEPESYSLLALGLAAAVAVRAARSRRDHRSLSS